LALQLCQRFHMLGLSSTECELTYATICEISGYGDGPSGSNPLDVSLKARVHELAFSSRDLSLAQILIALEASKLLGQFFSNN
jgi:hypothetical protein